jgi:hypothetical protein
MTIIDRPFDTPVTKLIHWSDYKGGILKKIIATLLTLFVVFGTTSLVFVSSKSTSDKPAEIVSMSGDYRILDKRISRSDRRTTLVPEMKQDAIDKRVSQKAQLDKIAKEKATALKGRRMLEKKRREARIAAVAERARKVREQNRKAAVKRTWTPVSNNNHVAPGGIAACIRKYESGGNYTAQNPSSTASGAYQFLDSTWQSLTGLPGRAMNYSPAQQDAAFWKLWNNGRGASQWVTSGMCGY